MAITTLLNIKLTHGSGEAEAGLFPITLTLPSTVLLTLKAHQDDGTNQAGFLYACLFADTGRTVSGLGGRLQLLPTPEIPVLSHTSPLPLLATQLTWCQVTFSRHLWHLKSQQISYLGLLLPVVSGLALSEHVLKT